MRRRRYKDLGPGTGNRILHTASYSSYSPSIPTGTHTDSEGYIVTVDIIRTFSYDLPSGDITIPPFTDLSTLFMKTNDLSLSFSYEVNGTPGSMTIQLPIYVSFDAAFVIFSGSDPGSFASEIREITGIRTNPFPSSSPPGFMSSSGNYQIGSGTFLISASPTILTLSDIEMISPSDMTREFQPLTFTRILTGPYYTVKNLFITYVRDPEGATSMTNKIEGAVTVPGSTTTNTVGTVSPASVISKINIGSTEGFPGTSIVGPPGTGIGTFTFNEDGTYVLQRVRGVDLNVSVTMTVEMNVAYTTFENNFSSTRGVPAGSFQLMFNSLGIPEHNDISVNVQNGGFGDTFFPVGDLFSDLFWDPQANDPRTVTLLGCMFLDSTTIRYTGNVSDTATVTGTTTGTSVLTWTVDPLIMLTGVDASQNISYQQNEGGVIAQDGVIDITVSYEGFNVVIPMLTPSFSIPIRGIIGTPSASAGNVVLSGDVLTLTNLPSTGTSVTFMRGSTTSSITATPVGSNLLTTPSGNLGVGIISSVDGVILSSSPSVFVGPEITLSINQQGDFTISGEGEGEIPNLRRDFLIPDTNTRSVNIQDVSLFVEIAAPPPPPPPPPVPQTPVPGPVGRGPVSPNGAATAVAAIGLLTFIAVIV